MRKITKKSRYLSIIIWATILKMTHSVCEAAPVTKSTSLIATNPTTDIIKELASKPGTLQLLIVRRYLEKCP